MVEISQDQKDITKIKMNSYKDCVWYMPEIDRCKLPGICGERYSKCTCKKGQVDELCVWITKFLKSAPKDDENDEIDLKKSEGSPSRYGFHVRDDMNEGSYLVNALSKLLNFDY